MVRDLGEDVQRSLWSVKQEDKFVKRRPSKDDFLTLIVANNDDARQVERINADVKKICVDAPAFSPLAAQVSFIPNWCSKLLQIRKRYKRCICARVYDSRDRSNCIVVTG